MELKKEANADLENKNVVNIVDKLIFIFMMIFLLSLTNSIFLNQVGYYGALLLLLSRYFISKQNPFEKSGLELVFIWFILAELISDIISVNQSIAFNHFLRRVLLIPIVYVTLASVNNLKTGIKFFWVYIGASLVTSLIYIYFAYNAYTHGVYGLDEAGTSFFQYPITAGEIISFSVVFLFAFLINEKVNWKYRLLLLAATGIAFLSLIATYKRTGWVGTFTGIFLILLLKKEWKIIIPGLILFIVLILIQEDISRVYIFKYDDSKLQNVNTIETRGQAYSTFPTDSGFVLSDYENGLVFYKDTSIVNQLSFPAPVINFYKWKDNYFIANLSDTRFILLEKNSYKWETKKEFISTGYTKKSIVCNNKFYVLDSDSGFTIFNNPDNTSDTVRYPGLTGYYAFWIDSGFVTFYSPQRRCTIFNLSEGKLLNKIYDSTFTNNVTWIYYDNSRFLLSTKQSLKLFKVDSAGLSFTDSTAEAKSIYNWQMNEGKLFALGAPEKFYELSLNNNKIKIVSKNSLDFFPQTWSYSNNKIYFTYVQRSKLNSIWDPLAPTNAVRLSLWRAGWKIFKDHPLFGVGDIEMQPYHKKYRKYYEKEIHGHLHNNFVHVLVALGLFGFLAVCLLLIKMYVINFRILKMNKGKKFISSYSLGVIGAFTAFIISGLTELNIWDHEIITLVYFTFALNIALSRRYEVSQENN